MHARFRPQDFDAFPEISSESLNQYIPAFAVDWARSSNVTRKMPLTNEIVKHGLIEMRRIYVHRLPDRKKSVHKVPRNHDVTETQGREKRLAKRADIDNARMAIQPLERRNGHALVSILVVIVILDNPGPRAMRPVQ